MIKNITFIIALYFLVGCSLVETTWEENKEDIIEEVVDALEDEKEKDRLLDEIIELIEERRATIAHPNSND